MELRVLRWLLAFLYVGHICAAPVSIHVKERRDYDILDLFFKVGILEEEYGYVLKGVKPISARQFYPLDVFPMKDLQYSENEFKKTLLVREAIPVWNRLCSQQDRFALKAIPVIEEEAGACGFEVQFIHVPKLREVIRENINLFRYVLGPNVEVDTLVDKLAYSNERFTDILRDDLTLIGIVLGFGSHNSIVGGRLETIDRLSISRDCAPFLPKSSLLKEQERWWIYGVYYLEYAGGKEFEFKQMIPSIQPSFGFKTIHDEILSLEAKQEPLPESLYNQPRFIFLAFNGGDVNHSLFRRLQKIQGEGKALLREGRRLDKVLEIIGGKKPRITCDRSPTQKSIWSLVHDKQTTWSCILKGAMRHFTDAQDKKMFKEALLTPPTSPTPPHMMGASREMLRGLHQIRGNLIAAQDQCLALSKDPTAEAIIPNQLYTKTVQAGTGDALQGTGRLRLKYVIEDHLGNILFAHNDVWIQLSETIPGFIHGLQGMRIAEKRTLFIHPSLGYGALTTLPPCALLVAHVELLAMDPATSTPLPPIVPLEYSWVLDERLTTTLQESIALLPIYKGAFYHGLLSQVESECPTSHVMALFEKE